MRCVTSCWLPLLERLARSSTPKTPLPVGDGAAEEDPQPLLDFRPVLTNRDVLALIVGYAAAIWGCVGLRQWIVVFLTFCADDQAAVLAQAWNILMVGAASPPA